MSGGALDYFYFKVEEAASKVRQQSETSLHRAFASHLVKVAAALGAVEWVYSGDGDDTADAKIRECVGVQGELAQATADAVLAHKELSEILERIGAKRNA